MQDHRQFWAQGFVPAAVLGIGLQILVVALLGWPPITGEFWGPDSYMRLARTLACRGGGACEGGLFPGTNAPMGEVIHWPFLQDRLLILGSVPLALFMDGDSAIVASASLFGPILLLVSIGLILGATRTLVSPPGLYFAGVLLVFQPWVFYTFSVPRTDHHGLQAAFFLAMVTGVLRLIQSPSSRRWALLTGASLGFALWVSTEALVTCLPVLAVLGLLWLAEGGRSWARANRYVHLSVVGVASLGLLLDAPPNRPWAGILDRLSVVHWVLFALIAMFWWVVEEWGSSTGRAPRRRVLSATVGLAVVVGVMALLFPGFFAGPLDGMDPRLASIWLDHTSEFIPVLGDIRPAVRALHLVSPVLAVCAGMTGLILDGPDRRARWAVVVGALLWFGALSLFLHGRWALYLHLLAPIPLTWILGRTVTVAARVPSTLIRATVHVAAVGVLTLAPVAVAAPLTASVDGPGSEGRPGRCAATSLVPFLQGLKKSHGSGIVLAPADWGGEVVFRTGLRTVASPYHRNAAGLLDSRAFMTATDTRDSRRIAERRGIDWVIVCNEHPWFPSVDEGNGETMYARLSVGRPPAWLESVAIHPDSLTRSFSVFAVRIGDDRRGGTQ